MVKAVKQPDAQQEYNPPTNAVRAWSMKTTANIEKTTATAPSINFRSLIQIGNANANAQSSQMLA
ncbi:hypothetical protein ACFS4T_03350 [Pseudomonas lini]